MFAFPSFANAFVQCSVVIQLGMCVCVCLGSSQHAVSRVLVRHASKHQMTISLHKCIVSQHHNLLHVLLTLGEFGCTVLCVVYMCFSFIMGFVVSHAITFAQ